MAQAMHDNDCSEALREQVLDALSRKAPLRIAGSDSKAFYGRPVAGELLSMAAHAGIVDYHSSELVLTARAGTPLSCIERVLAENGQMLGFEPPHFGERATLGGVVAAGLSGPRRPFAGSVRDFVLGVRMINGKGEILRFGGEVIKNVAGFDVSRLMVGAQGTLGVLLDISLKVLPCPRAEWTLVFDLPASQALTTMNQWAGQMWPLSAACHDGQRLYVRLSGDEQALEFSHRALGGALLGDGAAFWSDLREQRLPFFGSSQDIWRLSMPVAAPGPELPGQWLLDWGGAQRWLKTEASDAAVFDGAMKSGGHATRFRSVTPNQRVFQALPGRLYDVHVKLKRAFDPQGIFNPGRLYPEV